MSGSVRVSGEWSEEVGEYRVSRVLVGGEMSGAMRSGVRGVTVQTACGWEWRRVTNVSGRVRKSVNG